MKTAVVMIHYGKIATTEKSLISLKDKLKNSPLFLINNTTQNISSLSNIYPQTTIIESRKNIGFARAVNLGIKNALMDQSIDSVLLLNNDLTLPYGNIDMLRKTLFSDQKIGIVSPVLHHSGKLYDWGAKLNMWTGSVKHINFGQKPKNRISPDHISGAAMLIKRTLIDKIGLFDERFFLYFEDVDYCLRSRRAGFTIQIDPEVVAEHITSSSSSALKRTLYQWRTHLRLAIKYMFRGIFPTALIYNLLFYPLVIAKIFILRK